MTTDATATPLEVHSYSSVFRFQTVSNLLRVRYDAARAAVTTMR